MMTSRIQRSAWAAGPLEHRRGDEGFTFLEAVIVIAILPVIIGAIISVFIVGLKVVGSGSRNNAGTALSQSHDRQLIQSTFPQDVESAGPVTGCGAGCNNGVGVIYAGQPSASLNGASCVGTLAASQQLVLALTWQGTPTVTPQTVGPPVTALDFYEVDYVIQNSSGGPLSTTGTPMGLPAAGSPVSSTPNVELHRYFCDRGNAGNNSNTIVARTLNNGYNVATLQACPNGPTFTAYAPAWAAGSVTLNLTDNSCTTYSITSEEHS
jgi:hypothetical protein